MIRVNVTIKEWGVKKAVVAEPPSLFAPVADMASAISGTPEVGQMLTAASDGAWSGNPAPTLARSWQRDGADIPGATGATYVLTEADDLAEVRLRVTATNSEGAATAFSPALAVTYPAPAVANGLPDEAFDEGSGVRTIAAAGGFAGDGLTFSLVSPPAGVTIDATSGVVSIDTAATGALSAAIAVRATNSGGSAQGAFQLVVAAKVAGNPDAVAVTAPAFTTLPTLSAERTVGESATCDPGTFTGTPAPTVSYQWISSGEDIAGETASTWRIRAGATFACRVRLTNPGGSIEAITESATIKNAPAAAPTPAPAGEWSVAEVLDEAPLGRVAVTIGNITVPTGYDLRVTSRISNDDVFSATTALVSPNTVHVRPTGADLGATRYTKLWFRRIADEPNGVGSNPAAWFLATTEGTIQTMIKHTAVTTPPPAAAAPLIYTTAQLGTIGAAQNLDYGDSYGNSDFGVGTNGAYNGWAFPAAALTSHYFGNTRLGSEMSDTNVLKKLRHIISKGAGNDPTIEGGYRLQHGCRAAVAIAFIRRTPRLWGALDAREKNCCDAIMTGHLVCATTTGSDNSSILSYDLRGKKYPSTPRSQNPNFSLNIVGALYAAVLYYGGADACVAILEAFDVSDFRARLAPANLDLANAYKTYTYRTSGKLNSGTAPTDSQIESSCRKPVYYGKQLGDTTGFAQYVIDENMTDIAVEGVYHNGKPYEHPKAAFAKDGKYGLPVNGADTITNRRGRTENNSMANPWLGKRGMFKEFWARDGEGVRSSASYVVQGVRCQMDFVVCALAAGRVDRSNPVWKDFAARMEVGMGDLRYKYVNGYRSLAKNNTVSNNENFGPGWGSSAINGFGTATDPGYFFGTYDRIIKPHLGLVA